MARILVVDEHAIYRMGLCVLISTQMPRDEVIAVHTPIEALLKIKDSSFDLVLMGIGLPNAGTVDMLKAVRQASPNTRFAIMSASDTRGEILATLAAGVHGFISKHQSDEDILDAITCLLSGRIYLPRSLAETGDTESSASRSDIRSVQPDLSRLTKRQREVLQFLARGMSNREIAHALEIAEATTKVHIAALFRALGARNRTEAAYKAGKVTEATGAARKKSFPP